MSVFPDDKVVALVNKGDVIIDPYFDVFQGPNCYHCHLGANFYKPAKGLGLIDPLDKPTIENSFHHIVSRYPIVMNPGDFLLAETFEFLGTSSNQVIKLLNSSSLARVGISQAALGMINAGCGFPNPVRITLELINNNCCPIVLTPTRVKKNGMIIWGTEVLKIAVEKMESRPKVSYGQWTNAAYHNDKTVALSKMANRFKGSENLILNKESLIWGDYEKDSSK